MAEVEHGCPAWLRLLHLHSLLDSKGVLAVLWEGDSNKVPGTDSSYCDQIYSEFSDIFEQPGTPPERAIRHKIDLLLDSILPAKR